MSTTIVPTKKPRGAKPGHPHYGGGRVKGSISKTTFDLLQKAEQLDADPLEALLTVIGSDAIRVPQIDPETGKQAVDEWGECLYTWIAITTAERIQCCKSVLGYLLPKLAAQTISGANGGPIETAMLDITQILANPEMARQAQKLALEIAEQSLDPARMLPPSRE